MRRALLALAALSMAASAGAQDVDFGIKAGINLARLEGSGLVEDVFDQLDEKSGPVAGVFVRLPLGSVLSVQPEVLWSRKGAETDIEPLGHVTVAVDSLDLVLPLRADLVADGPVRPYLLAGPYLGINLDAKLVVRVLVGFDTDLDDRVRDTDWGLLGGAGLRFPARGVNLDLEARYGLGLSRLNEDVAGQDVKHRVFSVMAGLSF